MSKDNIIPDNTTPGNTIEADLEVKKQLRPKKPSMYKVILLNDDYTPMNFVVDILTTIFHKPKSEAVQIMLNIHNKGSGICGVYSLEVAEMRAKTVIQMAKHHRHPLHCVVEKN